MAKEITFVVEKDEDSGWFVASWDDPAGGGITTQGKDLAELQDNVKEAVHCHFEAKRPPRSIRLHFVDDPVLLTA
jgi:predicted RNase H-like HicB family nuclease